MQTRIQTKLAATVQDINTVIEFSDKRFVDALTNINNGCCTRQLTSCAKALAKISVIIKYTNYSGIGTHHPDILRAFRIINATPTLFTSPNICVARFREGIANTCPRLLAECMDVEKSGFYPYDEDTIRELQAELLRTRLYIMVSKN